MPIIYIYLEKYKINNTYKQNIVDVLYNYVNVIHDTNYYIEKMPDVIDYFNSTTEPNNEYYTPEII